MKIRTLLLALLLLLPSTLLQARPPTVTYGVSAALQCPGPLGLSGVSYWPHPRACLQISPYGLGGECVWGVGDDELFPQGFPIYVGGIISVTYARSGGCENPSDICACVTIPWTSVVVTKYVNGLAVGNTTGVLWPGSGQGTWQLLIDNNGNPYLEEEEIIPN